jgi:hypothetical protein
MMPPGYPGMGYSSMTPEQAARARQLVSISNMLGWGGLGLLFLGAPLIGFLAQSPLAGVVVAGLGVLAAIAGAIVGQVGRGWQGRVV